VKALNRVCLGQHAIPDSVSFIGISEIRKPDKERNENDTEGYKERRGKEIIPFKFEHTRLTHVMWESLSNFYFSLRNNFTNNRISWSLVIVPMETAQNFFISNILPRITTFWTTDYPNLV
jgi:hypothetical protein